jgi:hypothetical protein
MTKMYQAYAGKVLDGKPIVLESVMLPENADLVITTLNEFTGVRYNNGQTVKGVSKNRRELCTCLSIEGNMKQNLRKTQ